jgi:dienelactone hydrolase
VRRFVLAAVVCLTACSSCKRPAPAPPPTLDDAAATALPLALDTRRVTTPDGVKLVMRSGPVASYDGLPIAVDVTEPDDGKPGPRPLVVLFHGWTESKSRWESKTKDNEDAAVADWNNVAFASRGYAVLNYTIRGWHDSCGPLRARSKYVQSTLPEECTSRAYWVHIADPAFEIRDAQHLVGVLVDAGIADPVRVGVTGGSYGGAHVWLLALGGDWKSPGGATVHVAAAAPFDTWSSLTSALVPNGRASDRCEGAKRARECDRDLGDPRRAREPVGVPLGTYLSGFFAGGIAGAAFYALPGVDPTADFTTWFARVQVGAPFPDERHVDPVLHRFLDEMDRRSPLYVEPRAHPPIFQVQGFTDPLVPAIHALEMRMKMRALDPAYPIATFLGDVGHANAQNPRDQWDVAHAAALQLFDHALLGKGEPPPFDVTAMTTTCEPGQPRKTFRAPSFLELAKSERTFRSAESKSTTNVSVSRASAEIDPVIHHGCRTVDTAHGVTSAWTFPLTERATLLGHPRVKMRVRVVGVDAQLNVRLWDVDGARMTLVARGTYRFRAASRVHPDLHPSDVAFLATANAWELRAGHALRLELVGNAFPEFQPNAIPATITAETIELTLPVAE